MMMTGGGESQMDAQPRLRGSCPEGSTGLEVTDGPSGEGHSKHAVKLLRKRGALGQQCFSWDY